MSTAPKTVYDFTLTRLDNTPLRLAEFTNRPILVVNTASKCGFAPQLDDLKQLKEKWTDHGLEIIAFPSNQFKQEPLNAQSICSLAENYPFPFMKPVILNGSNTEPFFAFLKTKCPGIFNSKRIKWNFTKFFIDRSGQPILRFSPITPIYKVDKRIRPYICTD
ncbi:MAG: glutathione peroxidase [Pseudomonadota bacterium]|nr:glutathione peroxidase [Pseudomonadota bacterium]